MISSRTSDAFLALIRLGIGHESRFLSKEIDWNAIKALADEHGISAIILEALNSGRTNLSDTMPVQMKLEWIGEVLHSYELRYIAYEKAIGSLAGFYNQHGYKMMVLKGYACSLDWPKPKLRPCGDIDIWQFGEQKVADAMLAKKKGIKIETSHHHHTVFDWNGFSVENHYDFINVHHHKTNAEFEKLLKQLGEDDSYSVEVKDDTTGLTTKLYLPSPNLHALFLLKHLMMHFASEGIMLRQMVDWGFFVEKHSKEVDWNYVSAVLDKFGMHQMFNIINAICVGDLGFDVASFPTVQFEPGIKDRVLSEILEPKFGSSVPNGFFSRIVFKIRRWKANEWKHKLCYKESMLSAFWSGVWSHLMKPSSI